MICKRKATLHRCIEKVSSTSYFLILTIQLENGESKQIYNRYEKVLHFIFLNLTAHLLKILEALFQISLLVDMRKVQKEIIS